MSVLDAVIDVSHNNGTINWSAVAKDGIILAFIKATEGNTFVDPQFVINRKNATDAGLMVIPYHFMRGQDALTQAKNFIKNANLQAGAPAMLDWEVTSTSEATLKAMGTAVQAITKRVPIGYYGASWVETPDAMLSTWPLLLPAYPHGNTPGTYSSLVTHPPKIPAGRQASRPYDFQQYTPAGKISGISTACDRSVWIGTSAELIYFVNFGTQSPTPTPIIPPSPLPPQIDVELGMHSYGPSVRNLQNALTYMCN